MSSEQGVPNVTSTPLVSCLCVTRGRPEKLRRAIRCFSEQTYANKELLILVEEDDAETLSALDAHKEARARGEIVVHVLAASPKLTLGELRNRAIAASRGEYFCQWDDDDWYHVDRIRLQVEAVTKSFQVATLLTNWLMFDVATGRAYLSESRLWEGSILCRKSLIDERLCYPAMSRMEDSFFVGDLVQVAGVFPLISPSLYIYEIHSGNTSSARHFAHLLGLSQALSKRTSALVGDIMAGKLSVVEGSRRLDTRDVLQEMRYVWRRDLPTNEALRQYMADVSLPG